VTLHDLNSAAHDDVLRELLRCCGARRWAERMIQLRPFATRDDLLRVAENAANELTDKDWLEAFAAHPRIGEHSESAWSQREQAAALNAEDRIKQEMAHGNAEYERKFGFIFIVFASGKTPEQILTSLESRMRNDRRTEIVIAAREQRQITRARLLKLLES
jgi:OHCU decarboxylase